MPTQPPTTPQNSAKSRYEVGDLVLINDQDEVITIFRVDDTTAEGLLPGDGFPTRIPRQLAPDMPVIGTDPKAAADALAFIDVIQKH